MRSASAGEGRPPGRLSPDDLIDHVGAIVPDVVEAQAALTRAGFRLTPIVPLLRPAADGSMTPSGGRQTCLMLSSGYVEFQAIGSAAPPDHPLAERAARRWGIHVLALATSDAAATAARWQGLGLSTGSLNRWSRPAPVGDDALEFSFVLNDRSSLPEALVIATQHHTAELLRPAEFLNHPNGAHALMEVLISSGQPDAAAGILASLADVWAEPRGRAFRLAGSTTSISVGDTEWLRSRVPAAAAGLDGACAVVISVQDLNAFAGHLTRSGARSLGTKRGVSWFAVPKAEITIGAISLGAGAPAAS